MAVVELQHQVTGEGESVLLLHGLGSRLQDWGLQIPALSEKFRVIACDQRGHGASPKPAGPYSMSLFAQDAADLLARLDAGPAHIVGISLGGMVALQLALDHPELVASITIVNSAPEVTIRTLRQRREFWLRWFILHVLGMKRMGAFVAGKVFPDEGEEENRATMAEAWGRNDKRCYIASTRALVGWSVLDRLGEIAVPTLIVSGSKPYSSSLASESRLAEIAGAEMVVIEQARHAAPIQQPQEFNALLLEFLTGLAGNTLD